MGRVEHLARACGVGPSARAEVGVEHDLRARHPRPPQQGEQLLVPRIVEQGQGEAGQVTVPARQIASPIAAASRRRSSWRTGALFRQ